MPFLTIRKLLFLITFIFFCCKVDCYCTGIENNSDSFLVDSIQNLMIKGQLVEAKKISNQWVQSVIKKHGKLSIHENIPRLILGRVCLQRQEYGEALKNFKHCQKIMDSTTGWMYPDYAIILNHVAFVQLRIGEVTEAKKNLDKVLTVHEKTLGKRNVNYGHYLVNRGILAQKEGNYDLAEKLFYESKEYLTLPSYGRRFDKNFIEVDLFRAYLYTISYRQDEGKVIFDSLIHIMDQKGYDKSANYARTLLQLGFAYEVDGEYMKAIEVLNKALLLTYDLVGEVHFATASVQHRLASVYIILSHFHKAEKLLEKAIIVYKNDPTEKFRYAHAKLDLVNIYLKTGRYSEAKNYLTDVRKSLGDEAEDFYYLRNTQARYDIINGKFIHAEMSMSETLSIMEKNKLQYLRDFTVTSLGLIELNTYLGRTARAEQALNNGFKFLTKINQDSSVNFIDALVERAFIYLVEGQTAKSINDLHQAKSMTDSLFDTDHLKKAYIHSYLGNNFYQMVQYDSAKYHYIKSMEIFKKHVTDYEMRYILTQKYFADILMREEKYDEALKIFKHLEGKPIPKTLIHTSTLGSEALLYALMEDFESANSLIIKALNYRFEFYDQTLSFSSTQEKAKYLTQTRILFDIFYSIIYRQGENVPGEVMKQCLNFQFKYKSYFIEDTEERVKHLKVYQKDRIKQGFPSYASYLFNLRDRIASLNYMTSEERDSLKVDPYELIDQINDLEKTLVYAADAYVDSVVTTKLNTWVDIQRKLQEKEAFVKVVRLNTVDPQNAKYVGLYVDKTVDVPQIIQLGNALEFEDQVFHEYKKQSTPLGRSLVFMDTEKVTYDPYNHYWKPIKDKLESASKEIDKVFFCPDGIYQLVNVNTLRNPVSEQYVIQEDFVFQVSTSTEVLKDRRPSSEIERTALLVGNPKFNEDERNDSPSINQARGINIHLDELPGTEKEIRISEQLLEKKGWKVTVKSREEATEKLFKEIKKSPTVIHIATHGFFVNNLKNSIAASQLLKSGLFFSEFSQRNRRSNEEIYRSGIDGILTAYEVLTLNLSNTELVILSACQTGVSDIKEGEGISGLQYAFMIAGVRSIVMSLWSVDDQATQKLMSHFYENWNRYGDKYQAFREAQIQVMKEYKKPYYWGAFVLVN